MNNTFTFGNKKYVYNLGNPFVIDEEKIMHFSCPKLKIDQDFLMEDIPELILDLPNIAQNIKNSKKQESILHIRIKVSEKKIIAKKAIDKGYRSTSAYIRDLALR